jgi:hypothetical protein
MAETVHLCNIVVLAVSAVLTMFAGGTVPPAAPPPPVPNPRHRGATGSGGSGQEMYGVDIFFPPFPHPFSLYIFLFSPLLVS